MLLALPGHVYLFEVMLVGFPLVSVLVSVAACAIAIASFCTSIAPANYATVITLVRTEIREVW